MQGLTSRRPSDIAVGSTNPVVWIPVRILDACQSEAADKFSLETGGTYMGLWADAHTAVVTAMVGPGPNAHHERHAFQPDQAWQLDEIGRHYAASGRRETYLGDWHSHPHASVGKLSWTDRRVLRQVITTPAARCPTPLMAVFWGGPSDWQLTVWKAHLRSRPILWDRLVLEEFCVNAHAAM